MNTRSPFADRWMLDPAVTFLNHGSFGACPLAVLETQREFRDRLERQPVRFMVRELEPLLDIARAELGAFIGADPQDLVFVSNATAGVNAVVQSLRFEPGDELLTTNHDYNACINAMRYAAERWGAKAVVADVPFPLRSPDEAFDALLAAVTPRTKLVMISHITSPTGIIFPVEKIVTALKARGVETLVDGAHAPGMVELNVNQIGAAYYTGNCHKWVCAPKGAAFLWVRRDLQHAIRPTVISHAANSNRTNRSRFLMEFDWPGTGDPTPFLCVPAAIRFISTLMPGGIAALRKHNRALALAARDTLCQTLRTTPPCPDEMIGSLASVRLPDEEYEKELTAPRRPMLSPVPHLQDLLWDQYGIEVPIVCWPKSPVRWVRVAAQAYNTRADYQKLCDALRELLAI